MNCLLDTQSLNLPIDEIGRFGDGSMKNYLFDVSYMCFASLTVQFRVKISTMQPVWRFVMVLNGIIHFATFKKRNKAFI